MSILEHLADAATPGQVQVVLDRLGIMPNQSRHWQTLIKGAAQLRLLQIEREKAKSEQSANNQPR